MTLDWEESARARLERHIASVVARIRDTADQIEREAKYNLANAAELRRKQEFHTYARAAGAVIHDLSWLIANASLDNTVDAAADADAARAEKVTQA